MSLRDPAGRVVLIDDRVFRIVNGDFSSQISDFLASGACASLVTDGHLVRTEIVDTTSLEQQFGRDTFGQEHNWANGEIVLQHERIPFQSYPYEWAPEMLYAAGELTLNLMERLLPEGFGLKDASPYNVLFRGRRPVFVDLLSMERRDASDHIWLPYAQFVRMFIRPLMVDKYFGVGLDQTFRIHREGLYAQEVFRMCGPLQKARPHFLTMVFLPALLSRLSPKLYQRVYGKRRASSPAQAGFILSRQVRALPRHP